MLDRLLRYLTAKKAPGWLLLLVFAGIVVYELIDAIGNVEFVASHTGAIAWLDNVLFHPLGLLVMLLVSVSWLAFVGNPVPIKPLSRRTVPVEKPWKDITDDRFGVHWVRTRHGQTLMHCPDHQHVRLMFRDTSGPWAFGPGHKRPLMLSDRPATCEKPEYGKGWLFCPDGQHDVCLDSDTNDLEELWAQIDGVMDARVDERAQQEAGGW